MPQQSQQPTVFVDGQWVTEEEARSLPAYAPQAYPQIENAPQDISRTMAPVREGLGRQLRQAGPMVAGLLNLMPQLRTAKAAFAIPTAVEGLRQLLEGESVDPTRAVMEGTMGTAAHGVGAALQVPGKFGQQQVRNVLGTTPQTDYLTKTAIREGADLSPEGILRLKDQVKALQAAGKLGRGYDLDDLIVQMEQASMAGGAQLPLVGGIMRRGGGSVRASGGGGGMLSPRAQLQMGERLARTGPAMAAGSESIVRTLLALLHSMATPVPLREEDR